MTVRSSAWAGRWPVLLAGAGVMVLLAGAAWLTWGQQLPTESDKRASLYGAALAAGGAACALVGWAWRRRQLAALPATAQQLDQAAATLAGLVREQWTFEAQAQALDDPEPMPVCWRLTSHLADHPHVIDPGGHVEFDIGSDRARELAAAFRALPRRRLVITGGPGTGKTTLAVQLVLALLPPAGQPPAEPVPVLVSLADWDPAAQPRITDWLAERISDTYPALRAISHDVPPALVEQNRVLPVLDGLDEIRPDRAAAIITALNTSLPGGVILTSRRPEYRAAITTAGDRLTGAAAVGPHPLTTSQAATYLRHLLPPDPGTTWTTVLTTLETTPGSALAQVVSIPLGLWLVRAVYIDLRPGDRPDPDALITPTATVESLRAGLLDQLIPALITARPPIPRRRRNAPGIPGRPHRHHQPEQLRHTLTTIATHLQRTGTRDWQWWNPTHAPGHHRGRAGQWLLRVRAALLSGTLIALSYSLLSGVFYDWKSALEVGSLLGCAFGSASLLAPVEKSTDRPPGVLDLRVRGRRRDLAAAFLIGLVTGIAVFATLISLVLVLTAVFPDPPDPTSSEDTSLGLGGLIWLAAFIFSFGVLAALFRLIDNETVAANAATPTQGFRGAFAAAAVPAMLYGLLNLSVALVRARHLSLPMQVAVITVAVVLLIPGGALAGLALRPWVFRIALTSGFAGRPWRTMRCLRDCHRLGLLRTVGPVYQFRHAELQDHLLRAH